MHQACSPPTSRNTAMAQSQRMHPGYDRGSRKTGGHGSLANRLLVAVSRHEHGQDAHLVRAPHGSRLARRTAVLAAHFAVSGHRGAARAGQRPVLALADVQLRPAHVHRPAGDAEVEPASICRSATTTWATSRVSAPGSGPRTAATRSAGSTTSSTPSTSARRSGTSAPAPVASPPTTTALGAPRRPRPWTSSCGSEPDLSAHALALDAR